MKYEKFNYNDLALCFNISFYSCSDSSSSSGSGESAPPVSSSLNSGDLALAIQLGALTVPPGGSTASSDYCNAGTVDSSGNIYCVGITQGDFAETNGGASDGIIVKMSPVGGIIWAKHLVLHQLHLLVVLLGMIISIQLIWIPMEISILVATLQGILQK